MQTPQQSDTAPRTAPVGAPDRRAHQRPVNAESVAPRRYLALLLVAELSVHVWGSLVGSVFFAVLAFLLLNHQLLVEPAADRGGPVHLVLAVAAVGRVSALAMSGVFAEWFGGYGLAAVPLAFAVWAVARVDGLPAAETTRRATRAQVSVALLGVPLALAGFLAARPRAELDWWDLTWQLWVSVGLFALAGAVDEWFYQGLVRVSFGSTFGSSGAGASAVLFALCHGTVPPGALAASVAGILVFGALARRTGSLMGACAGHAALNALLVLVLPYWWPH